MYLKLFLLLFPDNARTLQCFSLIYPLIDFYAVKSTYSLSPTSTINVVLNSVHSDSPSHAPISSWRTVLTSETIFLPEVLLLVFLLTEVCWVLVRADIFRLPSFLRLFSLGVLPRGQWCALCMLGAWSLGCGCVSVSLGDSPDHSVTP